MLFLSKFKRPNSSIKQFPLEEEEKIWGNRAFPLLFLAFCQIHGLEFGSSTRYTNQNYKEFDLYVSNC